MKPLFAYAVLMALVFLLLPPQASAAEVMSPQQRLAEVIVSQPAPNQSRPRPVQYYCRADCNACRRHCDYRYGSRRAFTLCMRDCWNSICRWC